MGVDAALADQTEIGQPLQQRSTDLCAFTNEHHCFAVAQTVGQLVDVLDVIGEDGYLVAVQLLEAVERAERVEIVVQDRDPHATSLRRAEPALLVADHPGRRRNARSARLLPSGSGWFQARRHVSTAA